MGMAISLRSSSISGRGEGSLQSTRRIIPIWTGIYAFLLIMLPTPLAILCAPLLLIPAVNVYVLGQSMRRFAGFYAIGVIPMLLLFGYDGWFALVYSFVMLLPAVVMGHQYRHGVSARQVLAAGTFAMTGGLVAIYLILNLMYPNMLGELTKMTRESFQNLPAEMQGTFTTAQIELTITMMRQMIPFMMFAMAFAAVALTHAIVRRTTAMYGAKLPGLQSADQWMLPKSWVWYYFGALFFDLLFNAEAESYMTVVLWNLIPILMIAFTVQAFSFLSFVAKSRGWNRVVPFSAFVLFPFLPSVVSLLGVMDVAFPIRKAFRK